MPRSAAATAAYYTRYLTQAEVSYPGGGPGAKRGLLGLSGEVSTEALRAVVVGP